jgi:hypothetical protein
MGIASAASPTTTTTTTVTTTEPERTGGSIFFETDPPGATIWVDNIEIGTSDTTFFSEKTGTRGVLIRRKGYEEYNGTVTVRNGQRVVFSALLTPVPRTLVEENTPAAPVTTATTIRKSTMNIPTTWPTPSPASPVDSAVVIGAAALGIGFFVIRRR